MHIKKVIAYAGLYLCLNVGGAYSTDFDSQLSVGFGPHDTFRPRLGRVGLAPQTRKGKYAHTKKKRGKDIWRHKKGTNHRKRHPKRGYHDKRPGRFSGYSWPAAWYPVYYSYEPSAYSYTPIVVGRTVDDAGKYYWQIRNDTDDPRRIVNQSNEEIVLQAGMEGILPHTQGLTMRILSVGGSYQATFDNVTRHRVSLKEADGTLNYGRW